MDRNDIDYLIQELANTLSNSGAGFGGGSAGPKAFDADKIIDKFTKSLKKTSPAVEKINEVLQEFDNQISATTDTSKKDELQKKKDILSQEKARRIREEQTEHFKKSTENFSKSVGSISQPLTSAIGKITASLQSEAESSTQFASSVTSAAIDTIGAAGKGVGKVIAGLDIPIVGAIGEAIVQVSDVAAKGAKFANDVLSKEVEKTVTSFNSASTAGAVFADGMTGLRNAAAGASLTVDQFASVIKKQNENLGKSGLGVTEATKLIGRVGDSMKKSGVQDQLLRLGYGFEEQAELTAQTLADMRRLQVGGKISDKTVEIETQKYAENLRTLSQITGEDAKAKAEKLRQENVDASWQLKMAEMDPKKAKAIENAMLSMTEIEKRAFKEQMVIGAVVSKDLNIFLANSTSAWQKQNDMINRANAGTLDELAQQEMNVQYSNGIVTDLNKNLAGMGPALALNQGVLAGMDKTYGESIQAQKAWTKESLESAKKNKESVKKPGDQLTDRVIGAAKAHQSLKVQIQEKLLPVLGEYAKLTKDIVSGLDTLLKSLGLSKDEYDIAQEKREARRDEIKKLGDTKHFKQWEEEHGKKWYQFGGASNEERYNREMENAANSQGIDMDQPGWRNQVILDNQKQRTSVGKIRQYASGGVASGPISGYSATLHGTEAVVPLPDNRSIPVSIQQTQNSTTMEEQLSLMKEFVNKVDELVRITSDHKDISNGILQNTY